MKNHWMDRVTAAFAPLWTLQRQRARIASEQLARHYDAAATGRRTQGWRKTGGDANAVIGPALRLLRENARDMVRNNPYAESALSTIADHTVGWGIVGKPAVKNQRAADEWKRWAESTDCDADGQHDFYGLQKLVVRTVAESGEVLVRRRLRYLTDGFRIPVQIQVLDPDFLDTSKTNERLPNGGQIVQGVEFDAIGRRVAYWLFPEHPGSMTGGIASSQRVPAEGVRHIFKASRPGQVRGPSWFGPVLLRFRDFDEFEDATLMKQKIAACLAVLTTDVDGTTPSVGSTDPAKPQIDSLEPGMILSVPPGQSVEVVRPPQAGDYGPYAKNVLRAIATGIGISYEDLTGDYSEVNFSSARMARLRHESRVRDWRWRLIVPQFCDPVWLWVMQVAVVVGRVPEDVPLAKWTAPPLPMVDPEKEGLAAQRNIRSGLDTWPATIRERGEDPDEVLEEIAEFNKKVDDLGIVLDSDPRQMTQGGQLQGKGLPTPAPVAAAAGATTS